ncbi:MAG: hypothetical protein AB8B81_00095 [Halioglobus sp.]
MIEHCLYGLRVFCDQPLFDTAIEVSAFAPGGQTAIYLKSLPAESVPPELGERNSLYSTHGRPLWLCSDRVFAQSSPGQRWCLEVDSLVHFHWVGDAQTVYYQLYEGCDKALLVFWFVHIFLPLFLTLERSYDFIHGSAIEIEEKPVLFLAPSMGGKSTLADYFLTRGHALLSDDKVATFFHKGDFIAVPSHPHHRPYREREVLGYPVENFASSAGPVSAIYLLEKGEQDSVTTISEVFGYRKFEQLLPHYLFSFRFLQKQRLSWLAQLADESLVFTVTRPWDLARMEDVYSAICKHAKSLCT